LSIHRIAKELDLNVETVWNYFGGYSHPQGRPMGVHLEGGMGGGVMALGDSARVVLGNHDLHLLAVAHGVRRVSAGDTLDDILAAPEPAIRSLAADHSAHYLRRVPFSPFRFGPLGLFAAAAVLMLPLSARAQWPQFRGPGGLGVVDDETLPVDFGPGTNLVWKTALPTGNSSACVWHDRLFVTGYTAPQLETLCLDVRTGAVLWKHGVPAEQVERGSRSRCWATTWPPCSRAAPTTRSPRASAPTSRRRSS